MATPPWPPGFDVRGRQHMLSNDTIQALAHELYQARKTRTALPRFEEDEGRLKINPLADWDRARIDAYFDAHKLPKHPLEAQGYPSIGCAPCTSQVQPGEDPRAGRWRGWDKTECGIHDPVF